MAGLVPVTDPKRQIPFGLNAVALKCTQISSPPHRVVMHIEKMSHPIYRQYGIMHTLTGHIPDLVPLFE